MLILEIHCEENTIHYIKWTLKNIGYEYKISKNNKRLYYHPEWFFPKSYVIFLVVPYRNYDILRIYNRYYATMWLLVCKHAKIIICKDMINFIKDVILNGTQFL